MKLPETDEEITEFIRAVEAGEIECPPPPNAKLLVRLCAQQTQIEKLEAECVRLHSLWHTAEAEKNWLRKWSQHICDIAEGWDSEGATVPKKPLSWESAARMAMDYAKAGLNGENITPKTSILLWDIRWRKKTPCF